MKNEAVILIAEDDEGHAALIRRNLRRTGIPNQIREFRDGQETLDFLLAEGGPRKDQEGTYLLLLDIRMPKVDGVEVLRRIKADEQLRRMPVIMITTTDDPREIQKCHEIGCNNYITKPVDYEKFVDAIRQLGLFLLVVEIPQLNGKQQ
jgi:CheY-like chemotaxis protein